MRHSPLLVLMLLLTIQTSQAVEQNLPVPFLPSEELTPSSSTVAGPTDEPAIQVTGGSARSTTTLVNCLAPAIETHHYVVRGQVKYDGVAGEGYLELWNDFGSKGKIFTRSLYDWGSMRKLKGSSNWREFELPFRAEPGMRPEKLMLNVVLPGAGTVVVAQPTLVAVDASSHWWTEPQAGLYGGAMGGCLGILGAIIGCLAGLKKMRSLTLGLFAIGLTLSGICLVVGMIAVVIHQPWHVYYPLLLIGIIGVSVLGGNLWNLLHRYRCDELRRIAAVDA